MSEIAPQWYWDRRNNKAYYPVETDDDAVAFLTVWHDDEVTDALENGVLDPIDEIGLDRTDTTFDMLESFRMPEDPESVGGQ